MPRRGLDLVAVGTVRFSVSLKEELNRCATGGAVFKALRGDFREVRQQLRLVWPRVWPR